MKPPGVAATSPQAFSRELPGRTSDISPAHRPCGLRASITPRAASSGSLLWGGPPATRSMAMDDERVLDVNVHVGGVLRSCDDAETWQATALAIRADVHQAIEPLAHDGRLLAATAPGLAISHDRGDPWETDARGFHASYARAVALNESTILLSVARGPGGQDAAVYRRPLDGGEPLVRCRDGLPDRFDGNIDTHGLVADGPNAVMAGPDGAHRRDSDAAASTESPCACAARPRRWRTASSFATRWG